jgi:probable F420-dependent oxidoreductase
MKFGVSMLATDESISPMDLGRLTEEYGFESLFFPEHTHIPSSRLSPYPNGGELPRPYTRTYDPFVALAMVAGATNALLLGFGICLVVERDPIVTAKAVASLDRLSGGRVLFGVGGGWNFEEMSNHGTDPGNRFAVLTERIQAMKRIWMDDAASYDGTHVEFEAIWSWPKPLQAPHPPILVGGSGPRTIERVLSFGDGWIPVGQRGPDDLKKKVRELNVGAERIGRDRPTITVFRAPPDTESLISFARMGVTRCLFDLPSAPYSTVKSVLEERSRLVATLPEDVVSD